MGTRTTTTTTAAAAGDDQVSRRDERGDSGIGRRYQRIGPVAIGHLDSHEAKIEEEEKENAAGLPIRQDFSYHVHLGGGQEFARRARTLFALSQMK